MTNYLFRYAFFHCNQALHLPKKGLLLPFSNESKTMPPECIKIKNNKYGTKTSRVNFSKTI